MRRQGPHATNTIARQSAVPTFTDKQIKGMTRQFCFQCFQLYQKGRYECIETSLQVNEGK